MVVPCDTTMEQMEHSRLYRFHEAEVVITKRDANLGERTMTLQSDVGFDYEIVYEVTACRDVPEKRASWQKRPGWNRPRRV